MYSGWQTRELVKNSTRISQKKSHPRATKHKGKVSDLGSLLATNFRSEVPRRNITLVII